MERARNRDKGRRFVPGSEGLEDRALQASSFLMSGYNTISPIQELPVTTYAKGLRIERLPFFLNLFQPGRFLPTAPLNAIQNNMREVAATLGGPNQATLAAFNLQLRTTISHTSLTQADAVGLNDTFTAAIKSTGAPQAVVASLSHSMNELAKADAASPSSPLLATSDYALVLQTFLGIDRHILRPNQPALAIKDGVRAKAKSGVSLSGSTRPTIVGTYTSAVSPGQVAVTMQVLDSAGNVIGSGLVSAANGTYAVQVAEPLAPGQYALRVRAVDSYNHVSDPSANLWVRIVKNPHKALVTTGQAVPAGPLGLSSAG